MSSSLSCFSRVTQWAVGALSLALGSAAASASRPELVVYTYKSFVSKWGPGNEIKAEFEKTCGCTVRWDAVEDAGALLARLKLEGAKNKADVVLGLDTSLLKEAADTGLFAKHELPAAVKSQLALPVAFETGNLFVPLDFGWLAFMYDSTKIKSPPTSLRAFLASKEGDRSLLLEDPRTSTVGLGMLLWIHAIYGDESRAALTALKRKTLTVTKGWSDAYGLFTKGEAPFVLSYITSEAYHRSEEKTDRYKAAIFSEGNYLQVEVAGVSAASSQKVLAGKFIDRLLSPGAQKSIASKNWMHPVLAPQFIPGLPKAFAEIPAPAKTLFLAPADVAAKRKAWISEWQSSFR